MALLTYENLVDPLLKIVRQSLVDFSAMKAGDSSLDVCCGTGAQVIEYGRRGITAVGIDSDENMLAFAVKNRLQLKMENISFYIADATALPFDDKSFDFVSVSFALHDKLPDVRSAVVSEMKRVVKKRGSLIFMDFNIPLPRNIWGMGANIVEYFAGGSHYQGFKDFKESGGLSKIVEEHGLVAEKTGYFKSGMVAVVKARSIV
ncbi:MAG: methyltransferase domain-containing protein [Dehalococcoidales bacterium]|nr:methyltransferase domain-containing protein [Dehalococcoidales bacterium]